MAAETFEGLAMPAPNKDTKTEVVNLRRFIGQLFMVAKDQRSENDALIEYVKDLPTVQDVQTSIASLKTSFDTLMQCYAQLSSKFDELGNTIKRIETDVYEASHEGEDNQ